MAQNLQRVHGGTQQVFAIDQLDGSKTGTITSPALVQLHGPKLDFFGIDLGGDPAAQLDVGGAIEAVIQCAQQLGVVHFYQVNPTADATNMSLALYPTAAWTDATLQTAIRALGTVNGYSLAAATVTDVGFRLANA